MRRLVGVLASGLWSCLRTELRSLFRATRTFALRQTFCSYHSPTFANSLTWSMQSACQSSWPLTCVFCATSFRDRRRRLNQVRTVFPTETVTTMDCEPESRVARQCAWTEGCDVAQWRCQARGCSEMVRTHRPAFPERKPRYWIVPRKTAAIGAFGLPALESARTRSGKP